MSGLQQLMMSNFSAGSGDAIIGTAGFRSIPVYAVNRNTANCFNPDTGVAVIFSSDSTNGGQCYAVTVNSDNTVTVGNIYTFDTGAVDDISAAYDTNTNKMVILYRIDSSDEQIFARVVNAASDRTITFGTRVTLDSSGNLADTTLAFAPDVNRFLALYEDDDGTDNGLFRNIQANSNNTITLRTAGTWQAGNQSWGDPNIQSDATYANGIVVASVLQGTNRTVRAFNPTSTSTSVGAALNLFTTPNYLANNSGQNRIPYVSTTDRWYIPRADATSNANDIRIHLFSNSGTTLTSRGNTTIYTGKRTNAGAALEYDSVTGLLLGVFCTYDTAGRIEYVEMTPGTSGVTVTNTILVKDAFSGVVSPNRMVGFLKVNNGKFLLITQEHNANSEALMGHSLRAIVPTGGGA